LSRLRNLLNFYSANAPDFPVLVAVANVDAAREVSISLTSLPFWLPTSLMKPDDVEENIDFVVSMRTAFLVASSLSAASRNNKKDFKLLALCWFMVC
jgi:hypothetical protein